MLYLNGINSKIYMIEKVLSINQDHKYKRRKQHLNFFKNKFHKFEVHLYFYQVDIR